MATPREQLAEILKKARLDAGYESCEALARKLNVSRPVVSKAENPASPVPSEALLVAWAGATGAPQDKLLDLAQRAKSGTPEWFMPFRQAEAEAKILRYWSPVLVPGVLQCESYMRAVLSVEPYTAELLNEMIAARQERQSVMGHAYITAIIDQHVLERPIGSPAVMAEQCAYLASTAERPDTALHVIPEGTNIGLWGGFDLATREGTTTVCLHGLEDVTSTTGDLVGEAILCFERILGAAAPRAESVTLIRAMEEQWKSQI